MVLPPMGRVLLLLWITLHFKLVFSPFTIQSTPLGGALLDSILPVLKEVNFSFVNLLFHVEILVKTSTSIIGQGAVTTLIGYFISYWPRVN